MAREPTVALGFLVAVAAPACQRGCMPPYLRLSSPVPCTLCRSGGVIVARCYWDFGRWSDLWRDWRPLPEGPPRLEDCMAQIKTQEVGLLGVDVVGASAIACGASRLQRRQTAPRSVAAGGLHRQ